MFADAGRSAIAQPGETFTTPIAPRTLSPEGQHSKPDAPTKAAPAESIPWHHAPQYLGQTVTVEGKIIDTHNTGKVCFLNFSPNKQHDFYIIIFDQVFDQLPAPPEQLYLHKTIQVRGQQIQVRSAKQITIVE